MKISVHLVLNLDALQSEEITTINPLAFINDNFVSNFFLSGATCFSRAGFDPVGNSHVVQEGIRSLVYTVFYEEGSNARSGSTKSV